MKIRLGYVAISMRLGKKITSSSSLTFKNYSKLDNREERLNKLKAVAFRHYPQKRVFFGQINVITAGHITLHKFFVQSVGNVYAVVILLPQKGNPVVGSKNFVEPFGFLIKHGVIVIVVAGVNFPFYVANYKRHIFIPCRKVG